MVSGFQDISSEDELEDNVEITTTQKASETPQNTSFDVDIDLTSDESEEETGVGDVVSPVLHSDDDSNDSEKITEPAKPVVCIVHDYSTLTRTVDVTMVHVCFNFVTQL